MISELAKDDIEQLRADGLNPSVADIIRLNALALKVEFSPLCAERFALPRVAFLGKLSFREPTIGHAIWIDSVAAYCDDNLDTRVSIEAFALTRQPTELPDAADREAVRKAVDEFVRKDLAPFTYAQIRCAMTYAKHGTDATALEYPVPPPDAPKIEEDIPMSIGAGVLLDVAAMGLGATIREIMSLTQSRARLLQDMGLRKNGVNIQKNQKTNAQGDYFATLESIRARLTKEKESKENG